PVLDTALVQAVALDRLLGRFRTASGPAPLCPGHPGNLVARRGQGGQDRAGRVGGRGTAGLKRPDPAPPALSGEHCERFRGDAAVSCVYITLRPRPSPS